jgi:glycosyltransferase involved in cell wall biosynthesis
MKDADQVLQATAWYPPHDVGGTEAYVASLVDELRLRGVRSRVLMPRHAIEPAAYKYDGVPVSTYYVDPNPVSRPAQRGDGLAEFRALLQENKSCIYHQHSWTRGCGLSHLEAAKQAGMRTVLTIHVPGNLCLRGTMMKYGALACDGKLDAKTCAACWANSRGLPFPASRILSRIPIRVSRLFRHKKSRWATAVSARAIAEGQVASFRKMMEHSDKVVVVCQWLYDAFRLSGANPEKLMLSRQGLSRATVGNAAFARLNACKSADPLKLLYIGRCHPVKGIETILKAVKSLPSDTPVSLSIRTPPGGEEEKRYFRYLHSLAGDDPRISFDGPVDPSDVPATMAAHDVLLVPSEWLETGPIVVLEAQAAGTFVIGSRLGGIPELVNTESGALVEPGSVPSWRNAIMHHLQTGAARHPLDLGDVRTMASVADDMLNIYHSI